jgi:transcriptional regulator with XRE-family HTH domain
MMILKSEDILNARKSLSMTQEDFAKELGITRELLSKIENGAKPISKATAILFNDLNKRIQNGQLAPTENVSREKSTKKENHIAVRTNFRNKISEGSTPIYEDAPFTLSNIQSYRDQQVDEPDFWVTIPGLRKCNYGCRAVGDSMHPLIRSHALVVGEEIIDWQSFFPKGDIYIIRARNGTETVKYIQPHPTDDTKFLLVPYNKKAATDEIKKEEILQLFKAKAVFNVL